jgi:hypothetical protein
MQSSSTSSPKSTGRPIDKPSGYAMQCIGFDQLESVL